MDLDILSDFPPTGAGKTMPALAITQRLQQGNVLPSALQLLSPPLFC